MTQNKKIIWQMSRDYRPISTIENESIKKYQELYNYTLQIMWDSVGIPKSYWGEDLTDEEIEFRHRQFLRKYNLL